MRLHDVTHVKFVSIR